MHLFYNRTFPSNPQSIKYFIATKEHLKKKAVTLTVAIQPENLQITV
jgi:hypothetical protein